MKSNTRSVFAAVVLVGVVLAAAGCRNKQSDTAAQDQDSHDEASIVTLTASQMELAEIATTPASLGEISITLTLAGEVALNQDRVAHITPRVTGIVADVGATLGSVVSAGDAMAVIESSELGAAKARYLGVKQQLEMAETDFLRMRTVHDNTVTMLAFLQSSPAMDQLSEMDELDLGENRSRLVSAYTDLVLTRTTYVREKTLYEKKISGEGEYLAAESAHKKAEADYAATRDEIRFSNERSLLETTRAQRLAALSLQTGERQLHLLGLGEAAVEALAQGKEPEEELARYIIRAPFDATVIEKHITLGEQVQAASELYTIGDLSTVWIIANVYEPDLPAVVKGQTATFSVRSYPNRPFDGEVSWVSDIIDKETRSLKIRLEVDNGERLLKPGMFADVNLTRHVGTGLTVPASAVLTVAEQPYVFMAHGEGRFEAVAVDVGLESEGLIPILTGISAGTEIVTSGVAELKSHWQYQGGE